MFPFMVMLLSAHVLSFVFDKNRRSFISDRDNTDNFFCITADNKSSLIVDLVCETDKNGTLTSFFRLYT